MYITVLIFSMWMFYTVIAFKHIPSLFVCSVTGVPSLTEQQLDSMCPSAAAIAAIVKPGMKFFDVSHTSLFTTVVS